MPRSLCAAVRYQGTRPVTINTKRRRQDWIASTTKHVEMRQIKLCESTIDVVQSIIAIKVKIGRFGGKCQGARSENQSIAYLRQGQDKGTMLAEISPNLYT